MNRKCPTRALLFRGMLCWCSSWASQLSHGMAQHIEKCIRQVHSSRWRMAQRQALANSQARLAAWKVKSVQNRMKQVNSTARQCKRSMGLILRIVQHITPCVGRRRIHMCGRARAVILNRPRARSVQRDQVDADAQAQLQPDVPFLACICLPLRYQMVA